MTVFRDVQRIAVVGAEAHVGRGEVGQKRLQRVQVLGNRAFADQHAHALLKLFARFFGGRRLVFGADPGGDIGVQVAARQLRAMPVDMPAVEQPQFVHRLRIAVYHPGIIHEFREADARGMAAQRRDIRGQKLSARRLHMGRGHAGGQLHPDVHHGEFGRALEIADALGAQHVGDLVRVADRGGDPARRHAAVEFQRRDQARFDVQMRVDEAGHQDLAAHVDHVAAIVFGAGADDPVAADRHVSVQKRAGHQVEDAAAAQDEIGGAVAARLGDAGLDRGHRRSPLRSRSRGPAAAPDAGGPLRRWRRR